MTSLDDEMPRGRKSLWTPANIVTCARVVLVPVWLAVAEAARASGMPLLVWMTFVLYVAVSLSDKLDGYLARSRDEITTFGMFLDPIADKLAVIVALLFLMELYPAFVPSWMVLVIVARELLVDGLRMVASSQGVVIAAGSLGKWKTAITMTAICVLLALFVVTCDQGFMLQLDRLIAAIVPMQGGTTMASDLIAHVLRTLGSLLMYGAVFLTVWSGVDYFVSLWPTLKDAK